MNKLKIEAGKFYRTRDGRKAGIYRTDVNTSKRSIHGYVIASDGIEYSRYWRSDGMFFNTKKSKVDLIEEWQEPFILDFDWDCLPYWCNKYVAKNKKGTWLAYSSKPKLCTVDFCNYDKKTVIPEEYQPKNYTGSWEDSVFKNPNFKVKKWFWMMNYCKENKLSPAEKYAWEEAKLAYKQLK